MILILILIYLHSFKIQQNKLKVTVINGKNACHADWRSVKNSLIDSGIRLNGR